LTPAYYWGDTWTVDNTNVVTVDGFGDSAEVSAVGAGSANVIGHWEVYSYTSQYDPEGDRYCEESTHETEPTSPVGVPPVVSIIFTRSGIPLANGTPPPGSWPAYINSVTITAQGTPSGGTYLWQIGQPTSSHVSLSNVNSQTVTVSSTSASTNLDDVLVDVSYTLNGQTGSSFVVTYVQKPTSLGFLSTSGSTSNNCSAYPGTSGLQKDINWQLLDQFSRPILFEIPGSDTLAANSGQNGCAISPFEGTPASLQQYTDALGQWLHHYHFCTGLCACQTSGVQRYFFNGFEIDQNFTFSCNAITVGGH
jgi:hypothetical protein